MKNKFLILGLIAAAGIGYYFYTKKDSSKTSELQRKILSSSLPLAAKNAVIETFNKCSEQEISDLYVFFIQGGGECNTLPLDVCSRVELIFSKYDLNKYFLG